MVTLQESEGTCINYGVMQCQMLLSYVGLRRSRNEACSSVYWIVCHENKYFMDGDGYIFLFTEDILLLLHITVTLYEIHRFRICSSLSIMAEIDRGKRNFPLQLNG
jgi:hypothetical protein